MEIGDRNLMCECSEAGILDCIVVDGLMGTDLRVCPHEHAVEVDGSDGSQVHGMVAVSGLKMDAERLELKRNV